MVVLVVMALVTLPITVTRKERSREVINPPGTVQVKIAVSVVVLLTVTGPVVKTRPFSHTSAPPVLYFSQPLACHTIPDAGEITSTLLRKYNGDMLLVPYSPIYEEVLGVPPTPTWPGIFIVPVSVIVMRNAGVTDPDGVV